MVLPPVEARPEQLFRLLSQTPRPEVPLRHSVRGVDGYALTVRGLTAAEHAAATDAATGLESDARQSRVTAGLVAASLYADGELAFADAHAVGVLPEPDAEALGRAVLLALGTVSPILSRCVVPLWEQALRRGAQHHDNIWTACAMHDAGDVAVGFGGVVCVGRPDRYYGLPMCRLTDGQLLAYRAGFRAVEAMRKHG